MSPDQRKFFSARFPQLTVKRVPPGMNLDLRIGAVCGLQIIFLSISRACELRFTRKQIPRWLIGFLTTIARVQLGVLQEHPRLFKYSLKSQSNQREFIKNSSTLRAAWRLTKFLFSPTKTKVFEVSRSRRNSRDKLAYKLIYDVGIGKLSRSFGRTWGGSECNSEHNFNSEDKKFQ